TLHKCLAGGSLLLTASTLLHPRRMRRRVFLRLFEAAVDLALLKTRKHLACEHFDPPDRFLVSKEARAADDVQMTEVAGLALEVDYLMVYGVRVASEEDALCYCLFGCDRPEGRSILGSGLGHDGAASFSGPRLIAVNLGGGLRRRGAG